MAGTDGIFDVPPEQLRETMKSVVSAISQSATLGGQCNSLVNEVVSSGAFKGPAAVAALNTVTQINEDLQKILQHGQALAEHLGTTANVVEEGESHATSKLNAVQGAVPSNTSILA